MSLAFSPWEWVTGKPGQKQPMWKSLSEFGKCPRVGMKKKKRKKQEWVLMSQHLESSVVLFSLGSFAM